MLDHMGGADPFPFVVVAADQPLPFGVRDQPTHLDKKGLPVGYVEGRVAGGAIG